MTIDTQDHQHAKMLQTLHEEVDNWGRPARTPRPKVSAVRTSTAELGGVPLDCVVAKAPPPLPVAPPERKPEKVLAKQPKGRLAGKLTKENMGVFFSALRERGYQGMARVMGMAEAELREELDLFVTSILHASCGVSCVWTAEAPPPSEYVAPEAVEQLSDLLHLYVLETALYIEWNYNGWLQAGPRHIKRTREIFDACLAKSQSILEASEDAMAENPHYCVHINEVFVTFLGTMEQLYDAFMDFPQKMDSETRPTEIPFELNHHLSGLVDMVYPYEDGPQREGSGQRLQRRLTLDTDRRGKDVSFEEIANVYRTSRVTIANIIKRLKVQLRAKLTLPDDDVECAFADREAPSSFANN